MKFASFTRATSLPAPPPGPDNGSPSVSTGTIQIHQINMTNQHLSGDARHALPLSNESTLLLNELPAFLRRVAGETLPTPGSAAAATAALAAGAALLNIRPRDVPR